ncbi:hypothetical protein ACLMJK_002888 [Lecanora helva]
MVASIWTTLVTLYLIFAPRFRKGKFAPRGTIIGLEIFTIIFWFCASIALILFAIESEPICYVMDRVRIIKKISNTCLVVKVITVAAALSWSAALAH